MNRLLSIALVCLLQWSLAVASTFNLKVEVTPNGAGSLNTSGGTYEEGKSINLRTSTNTGYVFKGWYDGETFLTSSTSFNYIMPARDATVQARYEFDPTVPNNPSMPDTTSYYILTTAVSPLGAGSVNITNGRYATGSQVSMRASANTGYQFIGWQDEEGKSVNTSTSFTYTMPRHNAQLTALFSFDPSVPANPDPHAPSYTVTVACKPAGGGTFNTTSISQEEGSNVRLYAYTNTGYQFLRWENEKGDTLSKEQNFYYVIPHGNSKVYGIFEFNPANPGNPHKNYWNKELGEVIVDDFTAGSLGSAVSEVISGNNRSDVSMIIVAGRMNENDFGIANNYTNCTLLDLSRVTGITEVPSYAFDYTNLESVYLPATIEKIGYRAFAECSNLSSLTIYAMTPPKLDSYVFQGVPDGFVVYVPAAALAQYQEADGWKDFTLLPIQEDIRELTVNLPANVQASDFAKMWLELTNTKSGQRMHYITTDHTTYTFHNIIKNTSWNVVLRNERGDIFGQIDEVEVKEEDVTVTFPSLSKPQGVSLVVMTPDGNDVTEQTEATWTDASGNYMAQGTSLAGLPIGFQLNYQVGLSQELAMTYLAPQPTEYILKDGSNDVVCQLQPIAQVKMSGKVKDAVTGLPLTDAVVSASQTFGGKYGKTLNAKTDRNGTFTLDIANVPTTMGFAATDYVSQTMVCDSLMDGKTALSLPDVSLHPITGATVFVEFTYTSVDGETTNWYTNYQNVDYALFNVTKNRDITQYNVQYPQIVLMEEVADGDVIRLTATSRTNAFMPVTSTTTVCDQRATASFGITELGQIQASFTRTGNAAVVATLYDAAGKLVKTYDYYNASLTISNLADGQYTLVSMGTSDFFNTIYDLAQLPQTGLAVGTDYVQHTVEVKSGAVSTISIDEVPSLNESKLYYTGDNTSFTVNKPSIVVGNYLTLTGRIDFKPAYATTVSNVQMIVDLPESCEFVENSVMVGNSTSSYTLNGNRIIIPMTRYTDRVRFCIIPTLGGEYAPSALAQFDLNGETITQPIGSAYYTAKDLSISVPSTVAKTSIPVSGTAIGTSNIDIYDNDVLIGQTTSLANGTWATTCELNKPYNLSTHSIYAKVTTKTGLELMSEIQSCTYNKDDVFAKTVDMTFYNAWMKKNISVTFDLEHQTCNATSYSFYHETDFTFAANLSNNDSTIVKGVTIGVYTDHKGWMDLKATYNEKIDRWVAVHKFGSSNLPTGVKVDIEAEIPTIFDESIISNMKNQLFSTVQTGAQLITDIDTLDEDQLSVEQYEEMLSAIIGEVANNPEGLSYEEISLWSDVELDEKLKTLEDIDFSIDDLNNDISIIRKAFNNDSIFVNEIGKGIKISSFSCSGLNIDNLLELGYQEYETTQGKIYIFRSESKNIFIDLSQDLFIEISTTTDLSRKLARVSNLEDGVESFNNIIDKINSYYQPIADAYEKTEKLLGKLYLKFEEMVSSVDGEMPRAKTRYNMKAVKLARLEKELANMSTLDGNYFLKELQVDAYRQEVKEAKSILNKLNVKKLLAEKAAKLTKPIPKLFTKNIPLVRYANIIYDGVKVVRTFQRIYLSVPDPCEDDQTNADRCQNLCIAAALYCEAVVGLKAGASALLDFATIGQLAAAAETGGVSALTAIATVILNIGGNLALDFVSQKEIDRRENEIIRIKEKLKCEDDKCPKCHKKPCECEKPCPTCGKKPCICCRYCNHYPCTCSFCPKCGKRVQHCTCKKCPKCGKVDCVCKPIPEIPPILDPSGFVYEGVTSNRLEGVIATVYYKETVEDMYGDLHENIVKWDAEEYAQENPLFTDENGMYRWDVPQGLWQVKFEKEGYETTYSDWLPVPPPQLDINIAMKQNRQPEVKMARAFEDAVELEFDKYMMPELLTTDNIMVLQNGTAVEGTIELLNEEVSYEGEEETFASKVRFNAAQPFTEKEVTLIVTNRVKSYAGIRMQDDYQQTFAIEQEIKQIVCDSLLSVGYGKSKTMTVTVLPASASQGKTLYVTPSSSMILGTETSQVTIGSDGTAQITVTGELPGTAALTFSVDGTDKTAMTIANVEQVIYKTVAMPTTSIASGTLVDMGTQITLSCATEGAIIYYTLDGSCPCDESANRFIYDGTPIVINGNVTIKAMAVIPGMSESDVAEFVYTVDGIEEVTWNNNIQVYPLPLRHKVNVKAGGKTIKSVTISSMNGMVVASSSKVSKEVALDVSMIPTGVYIIHIVTEDGAYSRKVMKIE